MKKKILVNVKKKAQCKIRKEGRRSVNEGEAERGAEGERTERSMRKLQRRPEETEEKFRWNIPIGKRTEDVRMEAGFLPCGPNANAKVFMIKISINFTGKN